MSIPAYFAPVQPRQGLVRVGRENLPPLLLVAILVVVALAWNARTGLSWTVPLTVLMIVPVVCLVLVSVYSTIRPNPMIAQMALYVGLWFVYPTFATQLTYLANTLDLPLRDAAFDTWDQALGFRWMDWALFVISHPWLQAVQGFAYESCLWQAPLLVLVFAYRGPCGRNAEFLTAMLVALAATLLVNMALPSLGPAAFHGFQSETADIIRALRAGSKGPFGYAGVIAFPSYHTVIAILYTAACRGHRRLFPAVLALNIVMLSAIPFSGNHYLVDMVAGMAIAFAALWAARRICSLAAISPGA